MDIERYRDYIAAQLEALVGIDSPSGFASMAEQYLVEEFTRLGYAPKRLNKGGVFVSVGGKDTHPLTLLAHADTLCAVVRSIKPTGRLAISNINFHIIINTAWDGEIIINF